MNGQTYLPISWVNEHINKRFYWDGTENMLVYALPDQIVYADGETQGANGKPLLLYREDGVCPVSYTHLGVYKRQGQDLLRPVPSATDL